MTKAMSEEERLGNMTTHGEGQTNDRQTYEQKDRQTKGQIMTGPLTKTESPHRNNLKNLSRKGTVHCYSTVVFLQLQLQCDVD